MVQLHEIVRPVDERGGEILRGNFSSELMLAVGVLVSVGHEFVFFGNCQMATLPYRAITKGYCFQIPRNFLVELNSAWTSMSSLFFKGTVGFVHITQDWGTRPAGNYPSWGRRKNFRIEKCLDSKIIFAARGETRRRMWINDTYVV